jgi:LemA protein
MTTLIVLGILVLIAFYAISLYNGLVKNRQMVKEGWSGIDVQLKRRSDLIPNLLESVKGYMGHERDTLEAVVRLRNQAQAVGDGHPAERAKVEGMLSAALGKVFALAEAYPDLKASQNFKDFQDALEDTENQIEMARRYYNGATRNLNTMIEQFPSNLVANQFGFQQAEYFELDNPADAAVPKVSFQR